MSVQSIPAPRSWPQSRIPLVLRIALRDLRGGLGGFAIFLLCISLGVASITGVNAVADGLRGGFEAQGRIMLGGDIAVSRIHIRADADDRRKLDAMGRVSEIATVRAMARNPSGDQGRQQALIELKGVDSAYPLTGPLQLDDGRTLQQALFTPRNGAVDASVNGDAVVATILLERLGLKSGDVVEVGDARLRIVGTTDLEPDKLSGRAAFGPRIFVSLATLEATGLARPGSLVRWHYRIALPGGESAGPALLAAPRAELEAGFTDNGYAVRDRREPSPQARRAVDRFSEFLTLVGLTALLVGGVGVANAVATFVERKRRVIATMKSLGAPSGRVFGIFLTEVMLLAALGIALGLVAGYTIPLIASFALQGILPLPITIGVTATTVALAVTYGFLVALIFVLWPLGTAERIRPAALFRDMGGDSRPLPPLKYLLASCLAALALAGLAVASSQAWLVALAFCAGIAVLMILFAGYGWLVSRFSRLVPRPRRPELRLALSNMSGAGSLTRSVVLSLGIGLSLLVAVSLVDRSLVAELQSGLPERAPSYYFLDIPRDAEVQFRKLATANAPTAELNVAPMLRGRIVTLAGRPVSEIKAPPDAEWVLRGDRGLTYAASVPEGSSIVEGEWWPENYSGDPLVSVEADIAKALGLKIGDAVEVNVLGRNITARVQNLRTVKWESLAINFVLVFSPNTLAGAPVNMLATLTYPGTPDIASEARLEQALTSAFPAVTAVRVRDAIEAVTAVFERVMTAIRVAGSVTLLAGAIVLAGALATAQRRRIYQAVVLKTLGASRRRILTAHAIEYVTLALATALVAVCLGSIAAWIITTQVMEVSFVFSAVAVLMASGLALALVLVFGGLGTWRILRAPAVPYLRSE